MKLTTAVIILSLLTMTHKARATDVTQATCGLAVGAVAAFGAGWYADQLDQPTTETARRVVQAAVSLGLGLAYEAARAQTAQDAFRTENAYFSAVGSLTLFAWSW